MDQLPIEITPGVVGLPKLHRDPCEHAVPNAADQLHGICIWCYRDRLAEAVKENDRLRRLLAARAAR